MDQITRMFSSRYKFRDIWPMEENYQEWDHKTMDDWFLTLNEEFYNRYDTVIKRSEIDGKNFENMMNVSFLKDTFGIYGDTAHALAAVVQNRVKVCL